MWTRQHRRRRWSRHLVLPAITIAFTGYFGFHAFNGDYGIHSKYQLEERAVQLQEKLAETVRKREAMEARVRLLHDGSMEKDMLDEQVRRQLGMVRSDEIVVFLDRDALN